MLLFRASSIEGLEDEALHRQSIDLRHVVTQGAAALVPATALRRSFQSMAQSSRSRDNQAGLGDLAVGGNRDDLLRHTGGREITPC